VILTKVRTKNYAENDIRRTDIVNWRIGIDGEEQPGRSLSFLHNGATEEKKRKYDSYN
jgi:hypothetical protein